jgi:hypothetical protein
MSKNVKNIVVDTSNLPSLRRHLLNSYGGCGDARVKNHGINHPIKIDDFRARADVRHHFCTIFVNFPDHAPEGDTYTLTFDNAPIDERIDELVAKRSGECTRITGANGSSPTGSDLLIPLSLEDETGIRAFARGFNNLFNRYKEREERYPNSNWVWVIPRIVASLKRLDGYLTEYRDLRANPPDEKLEGLFAELAATPDTAAESTHAQI